MLFALPAAQVLASNGEFCCSWNFDPKNVSVVIIIIITSTSDLQPSTAIAKQLPGQ